MRSVDSGGVFLDEGGRGVYLMRTLRFDFHIGRLECVTCQVSVSHSTVGRVKDAGAVALENVGGRMIVESAMFDIVIVSWVSLILNEEFFILFFPSKDYIRFRKGEAVKYWVE